MTPAIYDQTAIDIAGDETRSGRFIRSAPRARCSNSRASRRSTPKAPRTKRRAKTTRRRSSFPSSKKGRRIATRRSIPRQHFTQPPPRYTDASLIRELEEKGIGRPSTYATILSNFQDREYVEKRDGRYYPERARDRRDRASGRTRSRTS